MNNTTSIFKYMGIGLIAGLLLVFVASSFSRTATKYETPVSFTDESGNTVTEMVSGSAQQKAFPLDTISAATTTYVSVPWNMSSAYQYQYFFKMRKIGVTPNVKIRLEERNASNSSIWSAIDSVSMSGTDSTKLHFRLRGTNTYGSFHRIAFIKTGTGAVARNIEFVIKPTN
jgi:hypothetical protein